MHGTSSPVDRFVVESSNGYQAGHISADPPTDNLPIKAYGGIRCAQVNAFTGRRSPKPSTIRRPDSRF